MEVTFVPWPYDAVARGVALLDAELPNWRTARQLDLLGVDEDAEILSLLFGDCLEGCSALRIDREDAGTFGFDLPWPWPGGTLHDWDVLTDAWREAIAGGAA